MKTKILFFTSFVLITSVSFSQSKVNINNLVKYGDKWFKENDDKPYTGLVFDLYKTTGNKSLEGRYKDGFKHGKWNEWYENGNKRSEGSFLKGKKNNSWMWFNEYGNLDSLGNYENDLILRLTLVEYFDNNNEKRKSSYVNKKLDGLFTEWYEDGSLFKEGNYKDGSMVGIWKVLDSKGNLYEGEIFKLEKIMKLFNEGRIENGEFIVKHSEGFLEYIMFTNGQPTGSNVKLYPSGQIKEKSNWYEGKIKGVRTSWYENGQKEEEDFFVNGKLDSSMYYYPSGNKDYTGKFVWVEDERGNFQNGVWTYWYENGQKKIDRNYNIGKLDGLQIKWYVSGQKESEETYQNGDLISKKEWNEDGSVKN